MEVLKMATKSHKGMSQHQMEIEPDLESNDPYMVLGVDKDASQGKIKKAYFVLIRQYPPETETEKFKLVRAAYEKIKSVYRRAETDLFLIQQPPAWNPSDKGTQLDTNFYISDAFLALRSWTDLDRTNFEDDFREIEL